MTVAAIVQARMGSSRLPDKVLRRIGSKTGHRDWPMLLHVVDRARSIPGVDAVMVATTTGPRDDAIAAVCRGAAVRCVRGPERDVLARYALAAEATDADVIIRLTSDCPLLDPEVAGGVLRLLLSAPACGYASNVHPPTWFDGTDVEAFTREELALASAQAGPDEREHVTTWMWQRRPQKIHLNLVMPGGGDHSALKLSVDTAEDLRRVQAVHACLRPRGALGWRETLAAHARAFPSAIEQRARKIFSGLPRCADHRAAYTAGATAASINAELPCPYTTNEEPLRVAWGLGWEDVMNLGLRP